MFCQFEVTICDLKLFISNLLGNDIKVRDSEGIQLANAKIDEIRNGLSLIHI